MINKKALVVQMIGLRFEQGYWSEKYTVEYHMTTIFGTANRKFGMLLIVQYFMKPTFQ